MKGLLERFSGFLPTLIALTLPLVFVPSAADSYILPRASIVVAGACLGTALALLLGARASLGDLRLPLIAAAAAAALAFAFSVSWPLGLAGSYTRYESLPVRLSYLGLAASSIWLIRTPRQRDGVVAAFVFATSVASIEALQQAVSHVAFRPDGNLGNANLLAALITMGIPLAIDRARRQTLFVAPWAAATVVMVAGLVVTTSRSGALGAAAGTLALATFAVPRRWSARVAALAIAGVGAVVLFILLSPLRTLNDDPPELRLHLWQDALRMISARPLTGWGEDATGLAFGRFLTHDYAGLVTFDRVHSGVLEIAATQGLLGLAALGLVVSVVLRRAWRERDRADVAALAGAVVGYSAWVLVNFDWAPATGMFWLLAGTLWRVTGAPLTSGERVGVRTDPWHVPVAVGLVLVAVVFAVLPLVADTSYLRGRSDLAVRVDPLQAQYHWSLGDSLAAGGDLAAGVAELRRAGELGETEPDLYVALGDREAQLGDQAAARRAYERALEIDPYFTPARRRLATLG